MKHTSAFFLLFLFTGLLPGTVCAQDTRDFRGIVKSHLHRYPIMEIQDLYKLALQASLGIEHFMEDTTAMAAYLNDELRQVKADEKESLTEPITPDSSLVRVNLRPFKARNGDPARLMQAMMMTAKTYHGARKNMFAYWGTIELMAEEKQIPFKKKDLGKYFQRQARNRFPAVHHSPTYERHYSPAYRVVLKTYLELGGSN